MHRFLKNLIHFVHDLDPPGRVAKMPAGSVAALVVIGVVLLCVAIAIIAAWAVRGARK